MSPICSSYVCQISFPRQASYRIRIAPLVISVLYRLECELPDHGSSSPSVRCRYRYVPRIGSQRRSTHSTRLPAMGIAAVYTLSLIGTNTVFNNEQQRISNSFFSCTLALNTVCTGACLRFSSDVSSFLTGGLHQVSLRSASGEHSVRLAMPRWAPTSLTSPSSSLNLVHFIPSLLFHYDSSNLTCTRLQQVRSISLY